MRAVVKLKACGLYNNSKHALTLLTLSLAIEGINGSGMMMSAVLKLIITMTIVVLTVVYMLQ